MRGDTTYVYDGEYCYYTCLKCGLTWQFMNDGTLEENQMYYCPKCGRRIVGVEGGGE